MLDDDQWDRVLERLTQALEEFEDVVADKADLVEVIELYELALKASWPEGAMGDAFDFWNAGRLILSKMKESK